ncbi:MAG: hypothetical protein IH957_12575, partial [Chloroflexi bacterium]|nr:hypothetical protein [Chloroflexota bacterium]
MERTEQPIVTKSQLVRDLQRLGVKSGDSVELASSGRPAQGAYEGVMAVAGAQGPAQTTILTNPNQFSGSETIIDFESITPGTIVTNQFAAEGVNFILTSGQGAGSFNDNLPRTFGPPGPIVIGNFGSGGPTNPCPDLRMLLSSPMTRIAFEIRTNNPDDLILTIQCFASGVPLGSEFFNTESTSFTFVG